MPAGRSGRTRGAALGALTVLAIAGATRGGEVLFVDDDAAPGGDGSSWAAAYRTLQDALVEAEQGKREIVEIRVGRGTYGPDEGESQTTGDRAASFAMRPSLAVRGGYAGVGASDPDERDPALHVTVLSGDLDGDDGPGFTGNDENSYRVVVFESANEAAVLDGFRVSGGNADGAAPLDRGAGLSVTAAAGSIVDCHVLGNAAVLGGGMHVDGGTATLERVVFEANVATIGGGLRADAATVDATDCTFDGNAALFGGGAAVQTGNVTARNPTWNDNRAEFSGGGAQLIGGSTQVEGGSFESNFAGLEGGGLYAVAATAEFAGVTFRGNIAGAGGGARLIGGEPQLSACRFEDNYADEGGGLHASSAIANDCTFVDNAAVIGAGVHVDADGAVSVSSSIFERNVADEGGGLSCAAGAFLELRSCRIEANQAIRLGGGLLVDRGFASVRDCEFVGNVVAGGFVASGGAIHLIDAIEGMRVLSTVFVANEAKFGAGVSIAGGSPGLLRCDFTDNAAIIGGGVYTAAAETHIWECTFTGNRAEGGALAFGGAVYAAGGATRVERCVLEANAAGQDGGGLYLSDESAVVESSLIVGNTAAGLGGGIAVVGGAPRVSASTLSGNIAAAGGGLANDGGAPTLVNCVLSANVSTGQLDDGGCIAPGFGGGVSSVGGAPLVISSTLSGNRAECGGNGGGVGWTSGTLANCVLWRNEDGGGGDESAQVFGPSSVVNYSCVQGLTGNLGGEGNIGDDPRFRDADGPDDVPGTADDDVRLAAGSPCIDAGDNDAVPKGITTDRAGGPRFVDDRDTKDTGRGAPPVVDMGAYEHAPCPGDVNDDGRVDFNDLLRILDAWGPCEGCPEDLTRDDAVDFDDLLVVLVAWGACA